MRIVILLALTALVTWYARRGITNPLKSPFTFSIAGDKEGITISGRNNRAPLFWIPESVESLRKFSAGKNIIMAPDTVSIGASWASGDQNVFFLDTCSAQSPPLVPSQCTGLQVNMADVHFRRMPELARGIGPSEIIHKGISLIVWHYRWGEMKKNRASHYRERYDILIVIGWPESESDALRTALRPQKIISIADEKRQKSQKNIVSADSVPFRFVIRKKANGIISVESKPK